MKTIKNLKTKYVSLSPGVQMICAVLLLVVFFTIGSLLKAGFSIENTIIKSVMSFAGISINLIMIGLTVVVLAEGFMLCRRYMKHEPLRRIEPISKTTIALMGSYASALCFLYREFLVDTLVPKPQLYVFNALGWILCVCGIAILLLSSIKLILCVNKE